MRIRRELVDSGPLAEVEASFAISACLSTGRRLADLAKLSITEIESWRETENEIVDHPLGLIRCASHWGWWLPAGRPKFKSDEAEDSSHLTSSRARNLWLPATPDVVRLGERALSQRDLREAARPVPMFATPIDQLRDRMKAQLRQDRTVRRAGTTIEALERWLTHAICLSAGGDSAIAHVVTGRPDLLSRTTIYYSSVSQTTVEDVWHAATNPLRENDDAIDRAPDQKVREQVYGSHSCPGDNDIEILRSRLVTALDNATDPTTYNLALTHYTVVLLSISVALRPTTAPVLEYEAFDPATGFGLIDDKRLVDGYTARLTWYPPAAREQLAIYKAHIEQLAQTTLNEASRKWESKHPKMLPFFMPVSTKKKSGKVMKAVGTIDVIRSLLSLHRIDFTTNFGRHFIRSKLLRRCSSETLQAFMGHWHRGTEPWGAASGLDPLFYRQDISGQLTEVLAEHGWEAQAGKFRAATGETVRQPLVAR